MPTFKRPTADQRLSAVGIKKTSSSYSWVDVKGAKRPNPDVRFFVPDEDSFEVIPKPGPDDWLANQEERGQSFAEFASSLRNSPFANFTVIYLQPLQFFEDQAIAEETLQTLAEFAEAFFGLSVRLLKTLNRKDKKSSLAKVTQRTNEFTHAPQVHAGDVLEFLRSIRPRDAFCVCAITLCDLYPRESWNFVFGTASLRDGVGVYSMARYLPETPDRPLLLRAVRVMCHEICHMFGMRHCIYFSCLMNGSNHSEEALARPSFLCPVCLRKLYEAVGFDVAARYETLAVFWEARAAEKKVEAYRREAEWLRQRLRGKRAGEIRRRDLAM